MLAAAAVAVAAGCGATRARGGRRAVHVQATLVDPDGDGRLERGPGEPLRDRTDLGGGGRPGAVLATFAQLTDTHVRDEESPARVPFLDRMGGAFSSTFRPQEALSTQVLAAAVRAVNRARPDAVLVTGDIVDSAAEDELDQALEVLDGGRVDPDTGAPRLRRRAAGERPRPVLLPPGPRRAALPGPAAGRRAPVHLAGPRRPVATRRSATTTCSCRARCRPRAGSTRWPRARAWSWGSTRRSCRAAPVDSAAAVDRLLAEGAPGRALRGARRPAPAVAAARGAARAADRPARGAGRAARRGGAPDARLHRRPRAGGAGDRARHGEPRPAARAACCGPRSSRWLREELRRAAGRAIVVATHNPLDGTDGGAAALAALDATPGVVAVVSGNGHRNRIRPHRTAGGGYWLIATSSLADFPQQARMFRLRRAARRLRAGDVDGRPRRRGRGRRRPASSPSSTPRAGARRGSPARAGIATRGCSCRRADDERRTAARDAHPRDGRP